MKEEFEQPNVLNYLIKKPKLLLNQRNHYRWNRLCPERTINHTCGDRGCGYFPFEVKRQDDQVTWKLKKDVKAFTFEYEAYKNEFRSFFKLINFHNDH